MFVLWIYFIELSLSYKEFTFSIMQFIIAIPLEIFLANSSYLSGFVFGYLVVLVIVMSSIFIVAYNFLAINKGKKKQ
jgi:hypothetical protein